MKSGYLEKALESEDPRFAEVLRKLGHEPATGEKDARPSKAAGEKSGKTARAYKRRDMRAEK